MYNNIENTNNNLKYLSFSVSVTSNVINSNDRLRLILQILNDDEYEYEYEYEYQWTERKQFVYKFDALKIAYFIASIFTNYHF